MTETNIEIKPIGIIRNSISDPALVADEKGLRQNRDKKAVQKGFHETEEEVSEIILREELKDLLSGIEEYSHLIILYWGHGISGDARTLKKVHPMGDESFPLTGLFCTCSPARPNPILMTVVELIERNNNILKVKGLDAIDKSPVVDIKPYVSEFFPRNDVSIPEWMRKIADNHNSR
ncbi:MAG: tRNA (N6-threonylcarbamoyladenosine(37)-N6)-methyltransferase TrmO [Methanomicrobiaceae archaeon]|nr:tRNA (N6-threonylcarbamoyladenosine(37)-N6)-methyltransferase TrmO [Methanomicrobiaceae archaeon]